MKKSIVLLSTIALLFSCKKEAGDGGNSSIKGHVDIEYRITLENPSTFTNKVNGADEDVYIIYGDHISPDDKVVTNQDGDFEFQYLRPGDYTIYTYSQDTNATVVSWSEDRMAIVRTVEIKERKEDVDAGTFVKYKKK